MTKNILKSKSKYIRICIPAYLDFFDFEKEYTEEDFPCRKILDDSCQTYWEITVELKTHRVLEWEDRFGGLRLFAKVTDNGIYTLLDKNKSEIWCVKGYVPNSFIPEKDGFGDYINLSISKDGVVTNWYDEPDFTDFLEYGFSSEPISTETNIRNFVDCFVRPVARRLENDLRISDSAPFMFYEALIGLSENPNSMGYLVWSHSRADYDMNKDIVEKRMPNTKAVRIDFRADAKHNDSMAYMNLFTDITLSKTGFYIPALSKKCKYTDLPAEQIQNDLFNIFKKYYDHSSNEHYFSKYLK